jgi:hypothetical protein
MPIGEIGRIERDRLVVVIRDFYARIEAEGLPLL